MTIIWAIIIGFIVGLVAKFLTPGRDAGGVDRPLALRFSEPNLCVSRLYR